jgi:hypothetical protein
MLSVENDVPCERSLLAVPIRLSFTHGLKDSLGNRFFECCSPFSQCVSHGLLVNVDVPKVMPDKLVPHGFECVVDIMSIVLVNTIPVDEFSPTGTTCTFLAFSTKFPRCLEAMQVIVAIRSGTSHLERL